ncbi:MAG: hypothetical protein HKL85_09730 [Acidimicrobiaceae bacterium]|nr:hypothetical protein [Acidimicrobiaceae bacterium]
MGESLTSAGATNTGVADGAIVVATACLVCHPILFSTLGVAGITFPHPDRGDRVGLHRVSSD